jgi:DNA-binding response OmpR family regulator
VFVVDSEYTIASTLVSILFEHGFDARCFTHAPDALQAARSEAPCLLISEVMLPRLSGIELAVQIQQQAAHCKVLLLSWFPDVDDLLATPENSGHGYSIFPKPMHPTELLGRVRGLVGTSPC